MLSAAVGVVMLLGAATGCGGSEDPPFPVADTGNPVPSTAPSTPASTGPSASPSDSLPTVPTSGTGAPSAIAASYCENLLPATAVTRLAGQAMGPAAVVQVAGVPGCAYDAADGSPRTVQVVNASSSVWAQRLPALQDALTSAGTDLGDQTRADLETAAGQVAGGFEVDADLACEIFSELATDTGSKKGTTGVTSLQTQGAQSFIVVEGCSSDEYSFLQVTGPDRDADPAAAVKRAKKTLQQVHGAPLQFSTPP